MGKFRKRIAGNWSLFPSFFSSSQRQPAVLTQVGQGEIGGLPANLAASTHVFGEQKQFEVLAASHIGRGHRLASSPRQDVYFVFQWGTFVVAGISDGVSSSKYSHLGAQLIAGHAPMLIVELLKSNLTTIASSWSALNSDLSKKIVTEYVQWQRRSGKTISDDLKVLREEAADMFAATLEFVVLDSKENENGEFPYIFVRVAGDGDLLLSNNSKVPGIRSLAKNDSDVKGEVGALPAFDGPPLTVAGTIRRGQSLLLCTDGIGDYISTDKIWLQKMASIQRCRDTSYTALADFVCYSPDEAFDDQTAIFIKL